MTSQKSQNKITLLGLMREDLSHRKWMLILSSFVQLIFGPVATLMTFTDLEAQSYYYYGSDFAMNARKGVQYAVERMTGSYLPIMMAFIAIVGALIVGVGGYRHLFNRRMTDMVNSVPVTRGKQFDSIYYNNWLIWFVPQLVSTIITTFIMLARGAAYGFAPVILRSAFFVLIGSAVAFGCMMHLTILAVVLSGTIFNALLNIVFLGFDLVIAFSLFESLCSTCFKTYVSLPITLSDICWVSAPLSGGYVGAIISSGVSGEGYQDVIRQFGSEAKFWFVLIATIIVAIVNLVLAYSLYIKRKSEESESGVSNKKYRLGIRCVNSVMGGLFAAVLIEELLYIDEKALIVWQILFAAIFCALIFGLIDMIHARSGRGFFSHWKQMIALSVVTLGIFFIFIFDITGFDKRVVAESNIEVAKVNSYIYALGADGTGYVKDPEHEGLLLERSPLNGFDSDEMYIDIPADVAYDLMTARRVYWRFDDAYLYDPLTGRSELLSNSDWDHPSEYFDLIIDKKSGLEFRREYNVWDRDAMEEIVAVPGFMEQAFPFRTGGLGYPRNIWITDQSIRPETEIPEEKLQELFDATIEDFKENYSLDYLEMKNSSEAYCLECQYYVSNPYGGEGAYWVYGMNIYVTDMDVRTIAIIEELGLQDYKFDPNDPNMDEYYDYGYDYY